MWGGALNEIPHLNNGSEVIFMKAGQYLLDGGNDIAYDVLKYNTIELGGITIVDGSNVDNQPKRMRTKDFIPVKPNTLYNVRLQFTHGVNVYFFYYDKNKQYIGNSRLLAECIYNLYSTQYLLLCKNVFFESYR